MTIISQAAGEFNVTANQVSLLKMFKGAKIWVWIWDCEICDGSWKKAIRKRKVFHGQWERKAKLVRHDRNALPHRVAL